jgi:hypothetical protein
MRQKKKAIKHDIHRISMLPGHFLQYGSLSRVGIAKKSGNYNKNNNTNNNYTIEWNKWYKSISTLTT